MHLYGPLRELQVRPLKFICSNISITVGNFRTIVVKEMRNITWPFFLYQAKRASPLNQGPGRVQKFEKYL